MDKRENKSWTKEEEVALAWYYQNGKSNAYMSKKLGRTTFGIAARLSKLRAEIGEKSLRSDSWSAEEDATLIRMYEAGASYDDIGFTLGRTAKAGQMRAYKLRQSGQLTEFKSSRRVQPNQLPQMELFEEPEPVRESPNKTPAVPAAPVARTKHALSVVPLKHCWCCCWWCCWPALLPPPPSEICNAAEENEMTTRSL